MIVKPSFIAFFVGALLFALGARRWTQMRMGFYKKGKRSREELRERAKKRRRPEYYLNCAVSNFIIPAAAVAIVCSTYAYARMHTNVDNFTYFKNDLATQKDVEVLFREDVINTEKEEKAEECNNKLHIPERFIGKSVDTDMYEFFSVNLALVYVNGTKEAYDPAPQIESGDVKYDSLENSSIQNAKYFRTEYNNRANQVCLYHYGRELSEFVPKESNFPFEWMFAIMSESMWSLESFLQYADREVGYEGASHVIDAYWVAFIEGKMLYRNAKLAVSSEEGANYSDCFLTEAFVSFEISLSQISPSNESYAKISYYIGISGESLLGRIDKESEPELYNRIGSKAMWGYQEAQSCYKAKPSFYDDEPGILDNITDGIDTLKGLGVPEE